MATPALMRAAPAPTISATTDRTAASADRIEQEPDRSDEHGRDAHTEQDGRGTHASREAGGEDAHRLVTLQRRHHERATEPGSERDGAVVTSWDAECDRVLDRAQLVDHDPDRCLRARVRRSVRREVGGGSNALARHDDEPLVQVISVDGDRVEALVDLERNGLAFDVPRLPASAAAYLPPRPAEDERPMCGVLKVGL